MYIGNLACVPGGFHLGASRRVKRHVSRSSIFTQIYGLRGEFCRGLSGVLVIRSAEDVAERDGILRVGGHCDLDRDLLVDQLEVPVPAGADRERCSAVIGRGRGHFTDGFIDRRRAVCQLGKVYSAFGVLVGVSAGGDRHRQSGRRLRRDRQQLRAQAQA